MNHQLDRAKAYLTLVAPVIRDDDADENRQFLYQSMILMLQAFFEEYLRCIISVGTFWKAPAVRSYLGNSSNDLDRFASMPVAQLTRHAQDRVMFKEDADRLKEIMQVVIGRSPFADARTQQSILDMITIRNIIAHSGGWPAEANVPTIVSPNVLVTTGAVGTSKFYKLHISRAFFGEVLVGLARSIQAVEQACVTDPELQI